MFRLRDAVSLVLAAARSMPLLMLLKREMKVN
jgi:hypothetical protein